jgi:hypothetical protein
VEGAKRHCVIVAPREGYLGDMRWLGFEVAVQVLLNVECLGGCVKDSIHRCGMLVTARWWGWVLRWQQHSTVG